MSSFTALRVLVTLLVTVSLLPTESVSMPLPSSPPYGTKRGPIQLMSTSPTPPLPPMIVAGQRRRGSFTQQRPRPILLTRRDASEEAVPRSEIHEHIHEHIHGHEPDYHHYDHDYPDRWTQEEMDHHSDHWAYHHGLLDAGDAEDMHAHIHEHIHADKREEEVQSTAVMTKRGLLGDVGDAVRPLLAPLEIIPGFVSIEKLLFGDGDQDGGLLKTVGGLLLRVQAAPSTNELSFSLLASKHERTQVYLAPVNDTSDASCGDDEDKDDDTLMVKVKLPLLDVKGSAVLMCASFAIAPPSALSLEACHDDEATDGSSVNGTSQFFTYTRSTGALAPILQAQGSDNKTISAVKANTFAQVDDSSANTTTTSTNDGTDEGPSMVKMLMHFTLATDTTQSGGDDDAADGVPMTGDAASTTKRSDVLVSRQSTDDGAADDDTSDDATAADAQNTDADTKSDLPAAAQAYNVDDDNSRIFLAPTMLNGESNGSRKACKARK